MNTLEASSYKKKTELAFSRIVMWMFEFLGINMHSQALFIGGHGPEKVTAERTISHLEKLNL